jgi:hypothetical protein
VNAAISATNIAAPASAALDGFIDANCRITLPMALTAGTRLGVYETLAPVGGAAGLTHSPTLTFAGAFRKQLSN